MEARETQREEAAPTFPTWRQRLEDAKGAERKADIERFLQVLKTLGSPMMDESEVHFIYYDPDAKRVALTGEMNQWSQRGIPMTPLKRTGFFYHTMDVRGPARIEYKFIVDGEWEEDPFCLHSVDNGVGERNSFFIVGDFHEPPELEVDPAIPHGTVEEFVFKSSLLRNRRQVYVYLPPYYERDLTQRYPTLYVHDGGEYLTRARLSTVLDNLIYSQDLPPMMAVMADPVDRIREYWANDDYASFLEDELIPHIDNDYRAIAHREGRGTMGASMGGLISTYLGLSRPHLFSKVGGQSSALFLMEGERSSALAVELRTRFDAPPEARYLSSLIPDLPEPVAFYLDVGKYEPQFIPAHRRLVPQLEAKGCPCFFQELEGGHNWTSWRAHLKDLLTFLWRDSISAEQKTSQANGTARAPSVLSSDVPTDRLLHRVGETPATPPQPNGWQPAMERDVEGSNLIYRVRLPECGSQEVRILVVDNQLFVQIPGQNDATVTQESDVTSNASLTANQLEQTATLPGGIDLNQITARYSQGVLEIAMPLPRRKKARRIPIELGE